MNVAFIVNLNLDDLSDLQGVAQEINDDLSQAGFEVVQVAPWQRPSLQAAVPITTQPTIPNQNQTTQ